MVKLRAKARYRSAGKGLFVEPGQVIDVTQEQPELLRRDSPGTFVYHRSRRKAPAAPPRHKMAQAEAAERKASERAGGPAMDTSNMPGLTSPPEE